jgi:hypothetical protein
MSESTKNYDMITVVVCIAIVCVAMIAGITVYSMNDRNNMAKNIEAAIAKGMDPLAVKCSYETHPGAICITYAAVRK